MRRFIFFIFPDTPAAAGRRSVDERSASKTEEKCGKTFSGWRSVCGACLLTVWSACEDVCAQQIHLTNPMQRNGSSFSESIGTNWGLSGKNWSLNVGSPQANNLPRYGGFDMNSGLRGGFQFQKGGTSGYFNGWAGQSNDRYSTLEAPSVTFMNGQGAFFQHVTETPFVVSTIPVVGGWHGTNYQPFYDPEVTLSPSVLQQRIDQLGTEKHRPRTVRETPGAPALKEIPKKKSSGTVGKKTHSSRTASSDPAVSRISSRSSRGDHAARSGSAYADESARYSRSTNPNTAETPALSVAEMKRRHRARQEQERTRIHEDER